MQTLMHAFLFGAVLAACNHDHDEVSNGRDCNDVDAGIYPGAKEVCDRVDNDCDGSVDNDPNLWSTWHADHDGDGFGDPDATFDACFPPAHFIEDGTDCQDKESASFPGNSEACDYVDNDCNGETDEGVLITFHADHDGDGYGNPDATFEGCEAPPGFVEDGTDCDDEVAAAFPNNPEVCDYVDNDCNAAIDDGVTTTYYADRDTDGFGNPNTAYIACEAPPHFVEDGTDCDDLDANAFPLNPEACDGIDNNCDDGADEGLLILFHPDNDSDGFGNPAQSFAACEAPLGWTIDDTDCDDADGDVFPGNPEVCDGADNNCSGSADEGLIAQFHPDSDGDTYGNAAQSYDGCAAPAGWTLNATDCNDGSADAFPGNPEVCDAIDNDCDGVPDDGVLSTYYTDADGDAFGNSLFPLIACNAPPGFVSDSTDCNDGDIFTWPGAPEVCNGVDDDCDGILDDNGIDSDGDGVDNCNDSSVYAERFGVCVGTSGNWGPVGWTVDEFANMPCCNTAGNDPLDMPVPGVPTDPEDWDWCAGILSSGIVNAGHSVAVGPDIGQLNVFTVSTLLGAGGVNVDAVGIVLNYIDAGNFFLLRWDDPNNAYTRTTKIEFIRCINAQCALLDVVDPALTAGIGFTPFDVEIRYDLIDVYVNGALAMSTITNGGDIGPGRVGVYAFDADTGSLVDSLVITQP